MRRPFFFHRLQWKLTRSYLLVTIVLITLLQVGTYLFVMATMIHSFRQPDFPPQFAATMMKAAPQFVPHLRAHEAQGNTLPLLLKQFRFTGDLDCGWTGCEFKFSHLFQGETPEDRTFLDERISALFLTDASGNVLATFGSKALTVGTNITAQNPVAAERLRAANSGVTDARQLVMKDVKESVMVAVPVIDENNQQLLGVFWAEGNAALDWDLVSGIIGELFSQLSVITIIIMVLGLAFGFITARNLTHRLNRLAHAAGQWGQGDFNERAPEKPNDELGVLGERLNQMAAELQKQMALQQQLAAMEERNRLALELHDTVKQQLFACAMQISAAQRLLSTNPAAAQKYLSESETLAKQMQDELTAVIQELIPAHKQQPALTNSLSALAADWTRQTNIPVALQLNGNGHRYAPMIERTLLRITQEAFANIARHSAATQAELHFDHSSDDTAQLTIADNGKGFEKAETNGGLGLPSMRERAESLPGGAFTLKTQPQQGTRIIVRFNRQ